MPVALAPHDLDLCARAIITLAAGNGVEDLPAALASALRNRYLSARRSASPDLARMCHAFLKEATGAVDIDLALQATTDAAWCRAMAINCLVWSGDLVDPTGGATSCHRHDIEAPWATGRSATALIGAYLFLR